MELPTRVLMIGTEEVVIVMAQTKTCNLLVIEGQPLLGLPIETTVQMSTVKLTGTIKELMQREQ